MEASTVSVAYLPATSPADPVPVPAAKPPQAEASGGLSFGDILSALNPLQYLPVVGTIYRAVTGDTIPENLRIAGSFVVSALTAGPLGILLNAATTAVEKLTGIDPESIAHDVAENLGLAPAALAEAPPAPMREAGALLSPSPAVSEDPRSATAMAALDVGAPPRGPDSDLRRRAGFASYALLAVA